MYTEIAQEKFLEMGIITLEELAEFRRIGGLPALKVTPSERSFYGSISGRICKKFPSPLENLNLAEFERRVEENPFSRSAAKESLEKVANVYIGNSQVCAHVMTNYENVPVVNFDIYLYRNSGVLLANQIVHELMHIHWGARGVKFAKVTPEQERIEKILLIEDTKFVKNNPKIKDYLFRILKKQNKLVYRRS